MLQSQMEFKLCMVDNSMKKAQLLMTVIIASSDICTLLLKFNAFPMFTYQ